MFVITGATGNIGSKVADTLLTRGEQVRVLGRKREKLQPLVDRGAEAAVGDLTDAAFLTGAFTGATAVFSMIPPDYAATDFRVYQNVVGENIATAIKNSGVRYVISLSSQGADLPEHTGPIKGLHDQEQRLNGLDGCDIIHLRPTYFMENLLMNIPLIKRLGVAGSAVRGDRRFAMIATRDIAAHVVAQLTGRSFEGKVIHDLLGQRDVSLDEATAIIGHRIGKPDLQYVQFSYEEAAKGMMDMGISADVAGLFIEMSKALNDGLFAVNRPRTKDNTTPTSIEDFAEIFARLYGV